MNNEVQQKVIMKKILLTSTEFKDKCKYIPSQAIVLLQSSQSASIHLALPQLETQTFHKVK